MPEDDQEWMDAHSASWVSEYGGMLDGGGEAWVTANFKKQVDEAYRRFWAKRGLPEPGMNFDLLFCQKRNTGLVAYRADKKKGKWT